eukprot:9512381-Lingulodinium_polyedra.AAC.1
MLRVPDPGPVVPEPALNTAPPAGELSAEDELLEVARGEGAARFAAEVAGRPAQRRQARRCAPEARAAGAREP